MDPPIASSVVVHNAHVNAAGKTNINDIWNTNEKKNMGPFNYGHNPNKNDVIAFLNTTSKNTAAPWVINDIVVGDERGTSTITREITVKPNCTEFEGSFDVTYTINSKIALNTIITSDITTQDDFNYYTATSTQRELNILTRLKATFSSLNTNQITISNIDYTSTARVADLKLTCTINPTSWSSLYTGTITGFKIGYKPQNPGGYTISCTSPTVYVNYTPTRTWQAEVTADSSIIGTNTYNYFLLDDTTGKLSINKTNGVITLAKGLAIAKYTYKVKVEVTNSNYIDTKTITTGDIGLQISDYNGNWFDITSQFTKGSFSSTDAKNDIVLYNESLGLIKINFINITCDVSTGILPLWTWSKDKYNVKSITYSIMNGGSAGDQGRTDLVASLSSTDKTQTVSIGPKFAYSSQRLCGYIMMDLENNDKSLSWNKVTVKDNNGYFDNIDYITCEYNSLTKFMHIQATNFRLQLIHAISSDVNIFTISGRTVPQHPSQSFKVTSNSNKGQEIYLSGGDAFVGWGATVTWQSGQYCNFDAYIVNVS